MNTVYKDICNAISEGQKLLSVLIDPDKMKIENVEGFILKLNQSIATHIFVGGSEVNEFLTETLVIEIKKHTQLPVILFPGDVTQVTDKANALLFLSLISGRNPDYLIDKQVKAIGVLRDKPMEVIPTGYVLIENGKQTSVERVSETKPMSRDNIQLIVDTAKAGEYLGMQLIYLEAGSGASHPIETSIIKKVKQELNCPLIVGGGIRSKKELNKAFEAGADLVVIGTAFEDDDMFFDELKAPLSFGHSPK